MNNPITQAIDAPKLADEVVRYCPECGTIGPLPDVRQACCPDSFGMSVRRWQAEKMERKLEELRTAIASAVGKAGGQVPPHDTCVSVSLEPCKFSGVCKQCAAPEAPAQEKYLADDEQVAALRTLSFVDGMKAGWNYCVSGDGDGFERAQRCVSEAMTILRRKSAAPEAPAQAAPPTQSWNDTKQAELNDWFLSLPEGRQRVLVQDKWMLAAAAFDAGKAAPPTQPEAAPSAGEVERSLRDLECPPDPQTVDRQLAVDVERDRKDAARRRLFVSKMREDERNTANALADAAIDAALNQSREQGS